jgi:hypothetical protein
VRCNNRFYCWKHNCPVWGCNGDTKCMKHICHAKQCHNRISWYCANFCGKCSNNMSYLLRKPSDPEIVPKNRKTKGIKHSKVKPTFIQQFKKHFTNCYPIYLIVVYILLLLFIYSFIAD